MSLSGGSASVNIREIDLSVYVPGYAGTYGAIILPAQKGPVDEPQLVTSEAQFLRMFTFNQKVEIGDSLAYYSALAFLQKSDKLWIKRVVGDNCLYGGMAIRALGQASNAAWSVGLEDPTSFEFDDNDVLSLYASDPGDWNDSVAVKLWLRRERESIILNSENIVNAAATSATCILDGEITINAVAGSENNGLVINVVDGASAGGSETAVLEDGVITLTIKDGVSTQTQMRTALLTLNTVILSVTAAHGATAWDLGEGTDTFTLSGGTDASSKITVTQEFVSGEPVRFAMLTSATGDALPTALDSTSTYWTVADTATTVKLALTQDAALAGQTIVLTSVGQGTMQLVPVKEVKNSGAFLLEVFKLGNLVVPVESFEMSMSETAKDGYGQNMFVEDVLLGSNYLRGMKNSLLEENPRPQVIALFLNGGDIGDPVTDGKMMLGADHFDNPETYPVTCFMDGGWATPAFQKHLDTICQNRHDCVALLSVPYDLEAQSNYLNAIVDYSKNILNLSSSYSALYSSHVKIYDKFNDRNLYVAPDGYAGAAISYSALNFEMWYPPAGFKRGNLSVLDCRRRFSKGEMDYLYESARVNPIRFYPGKGILIWGQKTQLGYPSALDRLNVRLLLVVIEPAIKAALEPFLFDLNDQATRDQIKTIIDSYLTSIKARRGLYDFMVKCDADNNLDSDIAQHRLNCDIYIKPTQSIEYINETIVIVGQSISFQLAQQLV